MQMFPGGILVLLYYCLVLGITIFVIKLFVRFVKAHERIADALEVTARKLRDESK